MIHANVILSCIVLVLLVLFVIVIVMASTSVRENKEQVAYLKTLWCEAKKDAWDARNLARHHRSRCRELRRVLRDARAEEAKQ